MMSKHIYHIQNLFDHLVLEHEQQMVFLGYQLVLKLFIRTLTVAKETNEYQLYNQLRDQCKSHTQKKYNLFGSTINSQFFLTINPWFENNTMYYD